MRHGGRHLEHRSHTHPHPPSLTTSFLDTHCSARIPLPFIQVRQVEVLFLVRERKSMNLTKMSIALRCEKYFKILHLLFGESILCQNIFSNSESCLINGGREFPQKAIKHTRRHGACCPKCLPN